ncbi:MAG: DUF134 domain-containing protein [Desulfobacteraceae bacterium]|nr:DUF134 domain-containing protein [Desulfobacteraceae bacterium]
MPRPRKCRRVGAAPEVTYFKPRGVPLRDLTEVYLSVEGFESLRLADLEGLSHEAAAKKMGVSRQTFGRILAQARNTVAKSLVQGLAMRIHGGDYRLSPEQGASGPTVETVSAAEENREMNKIAVSSEGPGLDEPVDPRFGRAAGFVIVDPETLDFEYLENGAAQARGQGAGILAAENVARAGAGVVLTGFVGPKAFQALEAAGIRVAHNMEGLSVREAMQRFNDGRVQWVTVEEAKGPMR